MSLKECGSKHFVPKNAHHHILRIMIDWRDVNVSGKSTRGQSIDENVMQNISITNTGIVVFAASEC
jgi:hypothetical protein